MKKITFKRNVSKNLEEKTKTDTLPRNEIFPTTSENPIKNTRRGVRKRWSEIFTERRKSRRLSNLSPLGIKIEIKEEEEEEEEVDYGSFDVSYSLFTNNASSQEVKDEIIDTDSVLKEEDNTYPIINESHTMVDHGDDNIDKFQNKNIKNCQEVLNCEWSCSTSNEIKQNVILQSIMNPNDPENSCVQMNNTNITKNNFISNSVQTKDSNSLENNFKQIKDSYKTRNTTILRNITKKNVDLKFNGICNNYINSHYDKPKCNKINDEMKPVILKCWSFNESEKFNVTANRPSSSKNCTDEGIEYFKMNAMEKKLFRKKYNFVSALGLISKEELEKKKRDEKYFKPIIIPIDHIGPNHIGTNNPLAPKISRANETSYYQNSSETIGRSFLLEYRTATTDNRNRKHFAIPVLIPKRISGSSFHPDRDCMVKCSSCHGKFESLDTTYHIAQIENPTEQKNCLEFVPHLIGPNSCLCLSCFNTIQKKTTSNNCMVLNCKQSVRQTFSSPFLNKIKKLLNKEGIVFRFWADKLQSIHLCSSHYDHVRNVAKCQFCGNLAKLKYDLKESEVLSFQVIFDNDRLPVKTNKEFLICKPCRTYFLWRVSKTNFNRNVDYLKLHETILTRICDFHHIKKSRHLLSNVETQEKEFSSHVPNVRSQIPSGPIISKVFSTSKPTKDTQPSKSVNYILNNDMSLNPVRSFTNNDILSLKPIQSDTNQGSRLVMVSSLQPIRNNCYNRPYSVICKSESELLTKNLVLSQNVRPLLITKPVSKSPLSVPANIAQFQTKLNIASTAPIRPRQTLDTLKKTFQPPLVNSFIKRIRINKYALHLFKSLQNPYYTSNELLYHLLLLEKYRKQGILYKTNHNTKSIEIENKDVRIRVKNNRIQNSFQNVHKGFLANDLTTQNKIQLQTNGNLINVRSFHKNEIFKTNTIGKIKSKPKLIVKSVNEEKIVKKN